MTRRAIPAVVLVPLLIVALVVSTSACGTIANFTGGRPVFGPEPESPPPPIAYGGVLWDVESALKSNADLGHKALIFPLWLVDLTLCATLDTATLPIVFCVNARNAWRRMNDEPSPELTDPPGPELSKRRGWFPDRYQITPAETVLNPPQPEVKPD